MSYTQYLIPMVAASMFYISPILIGRAFIILKKLAYKSRTLIELESDDNVAFAITELVMSFVYGAIITFGLAFLTFSEKFSSLLNKTFAQGFRNAMITALTVSTVIVLTNTIFNLLKKPQIKLAKLAVPIYIIALSLGAYAIWRWDAGLNTTLNWDLYEHQTIVNEMQKGNFDITPLNLSDTFQFNSYSTLFHVLIFQAQLLVKSDILGFWWFVEYFHLLGTIAVSYVVGYALTRNKWIGITSALFGAFIFESFIAYTSLFLIPQNLAATVIAAFLARTVIRNQRGDTTHEISTGIVIIYLLLNHLIIGAAGVAVVLFANSYLNIFKKTKRIPLQQILVLLAALVVVLSPLVTSKIETYDDLNRGEAEHFNLSIERKLGLVTEFYGFTFFILLPLGLMYVINRKRTDLYLLLLITLGTLGVVGATLPYTLKFYTTGRYLVHAVMAIGFWDIVKRFNVFFKSLSFLLLTAALLIIYTLNISGFKQTPVYKTTSTHVTDYEIEAAKFIKDNYYGQNVWIVSEPATMYILEGLSGVNSPGGVFTEISNREVLSQIYFTRDSVEMAKQIYNIDDLLLKEKPDKILFTVSGRFSRWQGFKDKYKFGIFWNVWTPEDLTLVDYDFINFMEEYAKFKLVFKNNGLAIFEVPNPERVEGFSNAR
ncbi:MAG: hypothetical protein ACOZAO_00250 [Patescibacteria group bacterium]